MFSILNNIGHLHNAPTSAVCNPAICSLPSKKHQPSEITKSKICRQKTPTFVSTIMLLQCLSTATAHIYCRHLPKPGWIRWHYGT